MLWALLLLFATSHASEDTKVLRPCFERYPNNRLVNVRPYHSEWRMRSEDSCLRFCAATSSRCRSIVFDSVQHICHFFLDEGQDVAVPAAKMIYLRVTTKECLESGGLLLGDESTPAVSEETAVVAEKPLEEAPPTEPTTEASRAPITEMTTLEQPIENMEQSQFAGSFDSEVETAMQKNEVLRDINNFEDNKRWQSSMEQIQKDSEPSLVKAERQTQHMKAVSREEIAATKSQLESSLRQRLEMLKVRYPNKFVELVGAEEIEADVSAEVVVPQKPKKTTSREKMSVHGVKKIKFTEEMMYPKKTSSGGDVRRKPVRPELKSVGLAPSFANKARSFLDSVNGDAEIEMTTERTQHKDVQVCPSGQTAVWLSFQNSEDSESTGDDNKDVANKDECKHICSRSDCRSFSFFETESRCRLNGLSQSMAISAPAKDDFTVSTSVKFCFTDSLPIFQKCSSFMGFRDYALQVTPREQFDGLPKGYEGLQLCIELCVLSTDYACKSASFMASEGRCLLNSDDSITRPDDLQESLAEGHLYFENGCRAPPVSIDATAVSVSRVPLPEKKSPLKSLQIKPIKMKKPIRINKPRVVQKSSYELTENDNLLQKLFKRE